MTRSRPAGRPALPTTAGPLPVVATGLGVRHASRRAWAVHGVDLVVEAGERVLLTGTSGAGKSTLLAAIGGLLDAEGTELAGELTVGGRPPGDARGRLGLLAQDPDSQLVMTRVGDDVAFGLENAGLPRDAIWPRVAEALAAVGFPHPLDRPTE